MSGGRWGRALNEGRSLNPGDTAKDITQTQLRAATLNEGRSLNPGDTPAAVWQGEPSRARSTKAGV